MLYPVKHQSSNPIGLPQKIVNRAIQKALGRYPLPRDAEPPFINLIRDDPINFAPRYDLTRARIAYGRLALPILMRDLEGPDKQIQYLAINSLTDLFHDPEKLYVAVELNIIDRIHQLLESSEVNIQDAALNALSVACTHYVGSNAVINSETKSKYGVKLIPGGAGEVEKEKNDHIDIPALGRLASMLSNEVCLSRYKTARVANNISKCWEGPEGLCENHFVSILLKRLKIEECEWVQKEILHALNGCLLFNLHEALALNGINILCTHLESKSSEVRAAAASCISALLMHPDGKTVANELDLLKLLLPLLFSEVREESANAAGCVAFMTMTTRSKLRALELDIIERLVFLAGDVHCLQLQLNAIKALTNISEAPKGRATLLEYYMSKISSIPSQKEEVLERAIQTLIKVIQWKP